MFLTKSEESFKQRMQPSNVFLGTENSVALQLVAELFTSHHFTYFPEPLLCLKIFVQDPVPYRTLLVILPEANFYPLSSQKTTISKIVARSSRSSHRGQSRSQTHSQQRHA